MQVTESITAHTQAPTARRFYRVAEAARACGLNPTTALWLVSDGQLPVVPLPSPCDEAARRIIRVPAQWLPVWLDMRGHEIPYDLPRSIPATAGPLYLTVAEAAESLAIGKTTLYGLIQARRFVPVVKSGCDMRIATQRLDSWCATLIRRAEREWSGVGTYARAVAR